PVAKLGWRVSIESNLPAVRKIGAVRRRGGRSVPGLSTACGLSVDWSSEEAANIHFIFRQASQANVAVMDEMHFEIGLERQSARMNFKSEPGPIVVRGKSATAIGSHNSFSATALGPLFVFAQPASQITEHFCQQSVQNESGKAESRFGQRARG